MRSKVWLTAMVVVALSTGACRKENEEPLTLGEASDALTEASVASQASNLTSGTIEISTNFTIGSAVEKAAEEVRTFVGSQLPCADIQLTGAKLTVNYGAKPGNCTYKGQTYKGQSTVEIQRNEQGNIVVEHTWTDLTNGIVKVSGFATVTWSAQEKSRHVVHELNWTRLSDGRTGKGTGDRTQTALEGGVFEGIRIDGSRSWEGEKGKWDLAIRGVEVRWSDPVPQAGSYVLKAPNDKSLTLSFERLDDTTIQVTLEGPKRTFKFKVRKAGEIDSGEESPS